MHCEDLKLWYDNIVLAFCLLTFASSFISSFFFSLQNFTSSSSSSFVLFYALSSCSFLFLRVKSNSKTPEDIALCNPCSLGKFLE